MRQIIFIAILILSFCFTTVAQKVGNGNNSMQPTVELIGEFNDTDSEWNKVTVDIIQIELSKNSSATGLIRLRNDKKTLRRLGILRKAMAFQKADLSRISLLLVDEQKYDINVFILQNCDEMPKREDCIVIRARDIDKIEKLFRPKVTRKRKK
jgi:hypothetical protein